MDKIGEDVGIKWDVDISEKYDDKTKGITGLKYKTELRRLTCSYMGFFPRMKQYRKKKKLCFFKVPQARFQTGRFKALDHTF